MHKPRILITGISGQLGSNLALCWRDFADICGVYASHPVCIPKVACVQADLTRVEHAVEVMKRFNPTVVIHAAALANIDTCEKDHSLADILNVTMTKHVLHAAQQHAAKFVYISTDAVYNGKSTLPAREDQAGDPLNYYARTKLQAEHDVAKYGGALIVRTSFYGFNIQSKQSLAEWIMDQLLAGKKINGFVDSVSSNMFTYDLASILWSMINNNLQGIFNVGCANSMSKYDFMCYLAKHLNADLNLITPVTIDSVQLPAKRSMNLALNIDKAVNALGRPFPLVEQGIDHFMSVAPVHPFRGKLCVN